MNKILLLFIGLTASVIAQGQTATVQLNPVKKTTENKLNRVNLGAFADATLEDFKSFSKLGFIYATPLGDGQSQIYIGDYESSAIAEAATKQVKAKGYSDARAMAEKIVPQKANYIQLVAKKNGEPINWSAFAKAGKIYVIPSEKEVKIVSAGFANDSIAALALAFLQKNGFKGAFLKTIAQNLLHKVGSFETGGTLLLNESIKFVEEEKKITPPPTEPIPAAPPAIDYYAGRFSNTQLKAALTDMELYKGKIDDTNDSRLESIFTKAKEKNRILAKYVILAQAMKPANEKFSDLQKAINSVNNNPALAEQTLKKSTLPIAKAYRAYILFTKDGGDVSEVNKLMNQAIQDAFKSVKENPFTFDPTATYSYQNLGQLILHLRYIQGVAKDEPLAPTWLFTEHPKEAAAAFSHGKNYKIVASDEFLNTFEELKMVMSMAQDLNPAWKPDDKQEAQNAQFRTQMYYLPTSVDIKTKEELKDWNKALWKGLEEWAKKDDANVPVYQAFKATYYRSLQRFENYFLSKKIKQEDATALSINILRQSIGKSLEKYVYLPSNSK